MPLPNTTIEQRKKLIQLYSESPGYKAAFDYFARSTRASDDESVVDTLVNQIDGCKRKELISLLKLLDKLNCGTFIVGRRTKQSRFEWKVKMSSVGRTARGQAEQLHSQENVKLTGRAKQDTSNGENEMLTHPYRLRKDMVISIELPENFTQQEAARVTKFIESLPLYADME